MLDRLGQQSGVVMNASLNSTPWSASSARVRGLTSPRPRGDGGGVQAAHEAAELHADVGGDRGADPLLAPELGPQRARVHGRRRRVVGTVAERDRIGDEGSRARGRVAQQARGSRSLPELLVVAADLTGETSPDGRRVGAGRASRTGVSGGKSEQDGDGHASDDPTRDHGDPPWPMRSAIAVARSLAIHNLTWGRVTRPARKASLLYSEWPSGAVVNGPSRLPVLRSGRGCPLPSPRGVRPPPARALHGHWRDFSGRRGAPGKHP